VTTEIDDGEAVAEEGFDGKKSAETMTMSATEERRD
jgi:hypothetical protein